MPLKIDEQFLTQILVDMVQIDSRNPDLISDGPGEAEIGEYIADVLKELGLEVYTHTLAPQRVNVVGILKGNGGGRSLLLNGHMDTVGIENMGNPFSGIIRDGKVYGRGSQDMKGSLAAMFTAVKALQDGNISLAGDVIIAAVADEEYESIGTADIVKHYSADAAIVTEPTDFVIGLAHRGFIWYEVKTLGRAAHGSRYEEGIDANMRMGRFLFELDKLEKALRQRPPHPLAGVPSLHAPVIQGGTDYSTYSARCLLNIERRSIPGETEPQATQEIQEILDKLAQADETFKAKVKPFTIRPPFEADVNADIVHTVKTVMSKQFGKVPDCAGVTFWTDAAFLAAAGIDTLLLGPTGDGLHSVEEWVDIASLVDLASILADTAINFCQ